MISIWNWYEYLILGLAAAIVYPDKILDWIAERAGRAFDWRHIVWLEAIAIITTIVAMMLLMPIYPPLRWWAPFLFVAVFVVFRCIMWLVLEMFGFRDS